MSNNLILDMTNVVFTAKHFWPNQTILKLNSFDFIVVHVANDPLKSLHKNDFGFMIDNSDPT